MRRCLPLVLFAWLVLAAPAGAATLEPIGTYSSPVFVTSEPPDPDRLLIVEQGGRIQLTEDGATSLFLNISSLVTPGGEQGLLSMAPAPDYATSKRFYVVYVNTAGDMQIDEYTASSIPVDTASRRGVLTIPHPAFDNHNGGQLQFGPDGRLYISTGDGGGTPQNAQDVNSLLGKILRIDPRPAGSSPYGIPPDNPFVGTAGADEIWSYGLRNPFRFSFDRSTGALLIGDVGASSREEVDYEPQPNAGRADNFGWDCREGFIARNAACSGQAGFTEPIHDYAHTDGNCSIIGGYVARDESLGDLVGRYLYADLCVGKVRSLVPGLPLASGDRAEGLAVSSPSSFGEDSCGRLYVASLGSGQVSRFVGTTPTDCTPSAPPPDPGPDPDPGPVSDPGPPAEIETPLPAALDVKPPALKLAARDQQRPGKDRKLLCRVRVDEESDLVVRLALITAPGRGRARGGDDDAGDAFLRLGKKELHLGPGVARKLGVRLSNDEARSLRRTLRQGTKLEARFRGRARDAAGNRSRVAEAVSALG